MSRKLSRLSTQNYALITDFLEDERICQLLANHSVTPYETSVPDNILDRYKLLVGKDSQLKVVYPYVYTQVATESTIQLRVYSPGVDIKSPGVVDSIDIFIDCYISEDLLEFKEFDEDTGSYRRKLRHYELVSYITEILIKKKRFKDDMAVEFFVVAETELNGFRIMLTTTDFSG